MEHFFPRIQVQTYAQMRTRVKLLEGMQMKIILKLLGGDTVKLLEGIYPPIPHWFRHPWQQVHMERAHWLFMFKDFTRIMGTD